MCKVRDNEMSRWFDCPMYRRCRDLVTLDGVCWFWSSDILTGNQAEETLHANNYSWQSTIG